MGSTSVMLFFDFTNEDNRQFRPRPILDRRVNAKKKPFIKEVTKNPFVFQNRFFSDLGNGTSGIFGLPRKRFETGLIRGLLRKRGSYVKRIIVSSVSCRRKADRNNVIRLRTKDSISARESIRIAA